MQGSPPNCSQTVVFVIQCHHLAIVAANGEITKVMISEMEETMKKPSVARSLFSRAGRYRFQLILKAITSCAEERSGWSCIASLFLPACEPRGPQEKGWLHQTKVRPHKSRRIAAKRGEYAKYFLL